jgi:hypothetical protein
MKQFNYRALTRKKPGVMNKLETEYAAHLTNLKITGHIKDFIYEPFKLRLAKLTSYTPDFLVVNANNEVECHECKGFMLDAANIKLKVAAETFPFIFKLVKRAKGKTWLIKEI